MRASPWLGRRRSIAARVAVQRDERVDDEADQHEPDELAEARFPHARFGGDRDERDSDRTVEQAAPAIAEAVEIDAILAIEPDAEISEPDSERDPKNRAEGVRSAAAPGDEGDGGRDHEQDRDVARGLPAVVHRV